VTATIRKKFEDTKRAIRSNKLCIYWKVFNV